MPQKKTLLEGKGTRAYAERSTWMRDQAMIEDTAMELKQALVTLLATAASMGIDVDVLCREASNTLASDDQMNWIKPFVPGAIDQIDRCKALAKGF